ncbi:MAG TPA: YggS family pyridoxal phosphate-dependent enzyme [Acidimicrobiia bacterium]|nr:YggS family pyridoxal phosphate-dependent enzyme [Acidimicrobiia bacterium]
MPIEQDDVPREVIEANLQHVRDEINQACVNSNRDSRDITLVAVTKTQTTTTIRHCIDLGLNIFGENRYQELDAKKIAFESTKNISWHFIGQIQRNKLARIAAKADVIHSIDNQWQIDVLSHCLAKPKLFLQLSSGVAGHRGGISVEQAPELLNYARNHGREITGVMMMPPVDVDPVPYFRSCRDFAHDYSLDQISMGMSHDYVPAIEQGSTVIRVGTALFGERKR